MLPKSHLIYLFILIFLAGSNPCCAYAAPSISAPPVSSIQIKSQRAIYYYVKRKMIFYGDVELIKGDMKITCKKMVFILNKNIKVGSFNNNERSTNSTLGMKGKNAVERIVAQGEVHILLKGREGFAREADYDLRKHQILLQGDVVLRENRNEIKGDRLLIDLSTNTSEIFSSKGKQVEIIFYNTPSEGTKNATHIKGR